MPRIRHIGGLGSIGTAKGAGPRGKLEYVGGQGASATSSGAMTFTLPEGVAFGDMLVVAIASNSSNMGNAAPGWGTPLVISNGSPMSMEVFAHVYTGQASLSFTPTFSSTRCGVLMAYRKPSKWIGLEASAVTKGSSLTTLAVPALAADVDCAMLMFAATFHATAAPVPTEPNTFAERVIGSGAASRLIYGFDDLTFRKGDASFGNVVLDGTATQAGIVGMLIK